MDDIEHGMITRSTKIGVLMRLQNAPPVAVAAHVDYFTAMESARNPLKRAGHKLEI